MSQILNVTINGERITVEVDPEMTLLDFLREKMLLTGTKKGCGKGECGADKTFFADFFIDIPGELPCPSGFGIYGCDFFDKSSYLFSKRFLLIRPPGKWLQVNSPLIFRYFFQDDLGATSYPKVILKITLLKPYFFLLGHSSGYFGVSQSLISCSQGARSTNSS